MQTLTNSLSLRHRMPQRAVVMLIAALAILFVTGAARIATDRLRPPAPPPLVTEPTAYADVMRWQARVDSNPDNPNAQAQLGLSLLRLVRETGDPALYTRAGRAFERSLAQEPNHLDALVGQGVLSLALHDFAGALAWAEQAQAINPFRAEIRGIKVDALVELGRYPEATAALQEMVDLRPDLQSYSRIAYLRELHGDVDGAIAAMRAAVDSGLPGMEATLWAQVQLGHLYFNRGDLKEAERIYQEALRYRPNYAPALGGLGHVQAARGQQRRAIRTFAGVAERLPLPEFVIPLGELYEVTGQLDEAAHQYELVGVIQQLSSQASMDVEMELALFNADHGDDPAAAVAGARAAYARRPTIHAADVLAWSLYQQGAHEEAWRYSQQALRLGTQDALFHYHAGMIAHAQGDADTARMHLTEALSINPYFSIRYAPQARALLREMR